MRLKCKKCGTSFSQTSHRYLEINDDEFGYRCSSCQTVHSWIDGQPIKISKINHVAQLGSRGD